MIGTRKNASGRQGSIWASGVMGGQFVDANIVDVTDDEINVSLLPGSVKDPSASGVPEGGIRAWGYTERADQGCSTQNCKSVNHCETQQYCKSYQVCPSVQDCPNIMPM